MTRPTARSAESYQQTQAALVAALTGIGARPPGFDQDRLEIARKALLRKRSGEIARHWPALRAALGERFQAEFAQWAEHRPTAGAWADGWDFVTDLAGRSMLPPTAVRELRERQLLWRYRSGRGAVPRRLPQAGLIGGRLMLQIGGRVFTLGR